MNEKNRYKQNTIKALFPECLQNIFRQVVNDYEEVAEIRIRRNGPLQIIKRKQSLYMNQRGSYTEDATQGMMLTVMEFDALFRHICRHSVYAFEEELKNGYLTVEGGHRIGIVGQTIWEGTQMKSIKYFNAINIRIAHEIKGAADKVLPCLWEEGILKSTLLISLPGRGKTTLLRELVRKISNGSKGCPTGNVSLIDERSELASCYLGVAQNDVGIHTDILDACPKAAGIMMVLRSMSPQVIAVDELGGQDDYTALQQAFYLGCRLVATIHGDSYDKIQHNQLLKPMLCTGGFERLVFLGNTGMPGEHMCICNEKGDVIKRW